MRESGLEVGEGHVEGWGGVVAEGEGAASWL